jgi:predicted RNase H-like nuclease (RuvC/YqgF family)
MFQQLQKKAFCLFHAWNILHHEPKWAAERESRNGKNNLEAVNGTDEANPNPERPPGRKAEKAVRKRSDSDADPFIEELKKMREDRQHIEKEWKECDDRLYNLEKQKMDLEQEQHDKMIMETDTSTMDKEAQLYFKLKKEEILARRFGRSQ